MNARTEAFRFWRRVHRPSLRRDAPVGITRSGSRVREYSCICGRSTTCCAKYPVTKQVLRFIAQHNESCYPHAAQIARALLSTQENRPMAVR